MISTITLIGAVGGTLKYTEQEVLLLLNHERTDLSYGSLFMGRPGTLIYQNDHTIVKIHSEIRLESSSANRWARQVLEKEKLYQVHHPDKTWFVVETTDLLPRIGNICPRLQPLHYLFSHIDNAIRLNYLTCLFDYYFRLASQRNIRLDESLSNFGVDLDLQLYYLDDDTYNWDRFISCAQILGVYFRSQNWLMAAQAAQLGQLLRELILKHFQDAQYLTVLAEQFKEVYLPTLTQQQFRQVFLSTLNEKPPSTKTTVHLSEHRYLAILADIHANFPALQAVLNFLKLENIRHGLVLGDIVGYGPHPNQCIEGIQDSGFLVIKGNHDHALATHNFNKGFSLTAAWVLQWSQDKVSVEQKRWLAELPPLLHTKQWLAVHGAPIDPTFFNAYVYEMTYQDNLNVLQRRNIFLCFHGHSHQPGGYGRRALRDEYVPPTEINLNHYRHTLVCPGSVGQPRNGQAGAQFAVYDQAEHKVYFHTLTYQLEGLLAEMEAEKFPNTLINILKCKSV